jgi:hypothetical protein
MYCSAAGAGCGVRSIHAEQRKAPLNIGKSNGLFHRRRAARSARRTELLKRRPRISGTVCPWSKVKRLVQTSRIVYCGKAKTDSNVWDGCNGTVATLWRTQQRSGGAVAGRDAGTQDGTTSTVVQRETAAQQRAVPHVGARRPCLLTHWLGEGILRVQDQTKGMWHSRASALPQDLLCKGLGLVLGSVKHEAGSMKPS